MKAFNMKKTLPFYHLKDYYNSMLQLLSTSDDKNVVMEETGCLLALSFGYEFKAQYFKEKYIDEAIN